MIDLGTASVKAMQVADKKKKLTQVMDEGDYNDWRARLDRHATDGRVKPCLWLALKAVALFFEIAA